MKILNKLALCGWSSRNFKRDYHGMYKQYTSQESWDNRIHQFLILCCNMTYSRGYEEVFKCPQLLKIKTWTSASAKVPKFCQARLPSTGICVANTLQKIWETQRPPSQRGQTQFVFGWGCKSPNTHLAWNSRSHQSQNKRSIRFWKGSPHCQQPVSLCTAWPCTRAFDITWPPIFMSECGFVAFSTKVALWLELLPPTWFSVGLPSNFRNPLKWFGLVLAASCFLSRNICNVEGRQLLSSWQCSIGEDSKLKRESQLRISIFISHF